MIRNFYRVNCGVGSELDVLAVNHLDLLDRAKTIPPTHKPALGDRMERQLLGAAAKIPGLILTPYASPP
jgi:hypothetical protein